MKKTFNAVANEWVQYYEGKVKHNTFRMYRQLLSQLKKEFGEQKITEITHLQLQAYLNQLHRAKYAKSTIQKHKITLNLVFKYYRKTDLKFINPCVELYLPKGAVVTKRKPLELEEIQVVFKHADDELYFYPLFLLCFGVRRSEALALHWEDVDLDNKVLTVNKTVEFVNNVAVVSQSLKNGDEERQIPILPLFYDRLKQLKQEHKTGIIFTKDGENYLLENQINAMWKHFRDKSGLSVTQHQFRHTYATLLYRANIDLKTAMELLGHKNIKMLLEIYAHADDKTLKKAIMKANKYIVKEVY